MGHGHVIPNLDGSKARCGGPGICEVCNKERADLEALDAQATAFVQSCFPPNTTKGNGLAFGARDYAAEWRSHISYIVNQAIIAAQGQIANGVDAYLRSELIKLGWRPPETAERFVQPLPRFCEDCAERVLLAGENEAVKLCPKCSQKLKQDLER